MTDRIGNKSTNPYRTEFISGNIKTWLHFQVIIIRKNNDRSDGSAVHDDVIKWKHFPRNWPFVREIHRSPVNFPHKGQWRGALMFSLMSAWINDWVNNREAGDLRLQHGHYDVIVMGIQEKYVQVWPRLLLRYRLWCDWHLSVSADLQPT